MVIAVQPFTTAALEGAALAVSCKPCAKIPAEAVTGPVKFEPEIVANTLLSGDTVYVLLAPASTAFRPPLIISVRSLVNKAFVDNTRYCAVDEAATPAALVNETITWSELADEIAMPDPATKADLPDKVFVSEPVIPGALISPLNVVPLTIATTLSLIDAAPTPLELEKPLS